MRGRPGLRGAGNGEGNHDFNSAANQRHLMHLQNLDTTSHSVGLLVLIFEMMNGEM